HFSLRDINDGSTISPEALRGHVYLLDFWATWCGWCKRGLPVVKKMAEQYGAAGFEVVALSLDDSVEAIKRFQKNQFEMPGKSAWVGRLSPDHAVIEVLAPTAHGGMAIPHYTLVDENGVVLLDDKGASAVFKVRELLENKFGKSGGS